LYFFVIPTVFLILTEDHNATEIGNLGAILAIG